MRERLFPQWQRTSPRRLHCDRLLPGSVNYGLHAVNPGLHLIRARSPEVRDVREMVQRTEGSPGCQARITARISRLALGNAGDVKPVGSGVSEMRVDYGPGYRVYFQQRGPAIALLLCAGDKSTQDADIRRAIQIAKDWKR